MSVSKRLIAVVVAALSSLVAPSDIWAGPPAAATGHQVVILSFDGARDIEQWQRSRSLAAVTGARFTYFLSCVYLLTRDTRSFYQPPANRAGRSNVGFAESTDDVADRLSEIWNARSEGHDIASHGCGHFDGKSWSEKQWRAEFAAFKTILRDAFTVNGLAGEPKDWRQFAETEIIGFRAPYLSTGKNLDAALSGSGFHYSASSVSRGPALPVSKGGMLEFSLPQIPEGPSGRRVIAMDYNLFVRHSGGFERGDKDGAFEARTLAAFRQAFDAQYSGERIPLQYGFHFTLMNDGAYWRALERFAKDVCLRADVDCISYADYVGRQGTVDATSVSDVGG